MAENQESATDIIQELALVTDALQTMFPDGKIICVYELNDNDFSKVQTFMEPEKTPVIEEKKNFISSVKTKISSWFKSGSPSV